MSADDGPRRARIRLADGRDRAPRDGHPWIYSGSVAAVEEQGGEALAEVVDAQGRALGVGFYSPRSRLPVRLVAAPGAAVDRALFRRRLESASALRRELVGAGTDGYRLANAEGDRLPGWTIDRFGEVLVSQITVAGLEALREEAYAALGELHPGLAILHRGDLAARRLEGLSTQDVWVRGEPRAEAAFSENGLRFVAELAGGQKTGFYCDQRESRARVERLAAGRSVLDLFAHTGAFATYALRGGAASAVLVESAARLLVTARRQLAANGFDDGRAEPVSADVFDYLRQPGARFGLVVCDPPPLAPRRSAVARAARAYKDLNRLALGRVESGGYLFTFSCSGAVDGKLFRQILHAAAVEAGVRAQLLAPLAAAADHPVALAHPEGEYLKGWLVRVAEPAAGPTR